MVLLSILFTSLFIYSSEMQQQQAVVDTIQLKFEHRNLFDTCINNIEFFEKIPEKDYVEDVYVNYLKTGSALLKQSFKEFIKRHSDELSYTRFRRFKGLAYAHSIIPSSDESLMLILEQTDSNFSRDIAAALLKERKVMMTNLNELSSIISIFNDEIFYMRQHYIHKDKSKEQISKNIEKSLRTFSKYAFLMKACYLQVS